MSYETRLRRLTVIACAMLAPSIWACEHFFAEPDARYEALRRVMSSRGDPTFLDRPVDEQVEIVVYGLEELRPPLNGAFKLLPNGADVAPVILERVAGSSNPLVVSALTDVFVEIACDNPGATGIDSLSVEILRRAADRIADFAYEHEKTLIAIGRLADPACMASDTPPSEVDSQHP